MTVDELKMTERMYSFKIEDFLKDIETADTSRLLFDEVNKFRQSIGAIVQKENK